jgi:DNA polymerase-3 subunit delta
VPPLDVAALRSHIQAGALAPLYLLAGEDIKLIDRMIDGIESTIDPADRPFAVERLYAGEPGGSPIDIAAAARVYPMLGDRRLVFVLRAERLLKPKRASKAAAEIEDAEEASAEEAGLDCAPLEEYLAAPSATTTLIFVATDVDRSRRFTKRVIEKAQVVTFGGLAAEGRSGARDGGMDAAAIVKAELAREGRTMDPRAVALLTERSGGDITKLRSDLERLLLYTAGESRISASQVAEVVSDEATSTDDWALVNAIGDGDAARALTEAACRLDRGDSPHALMGQLRWWVSARLAPAAPQRVPSAIDALLRTDLALKSSGGDQRVLIERLVVELTVERPAKARHYDRGRSVR